MIETQVIFSVYSFPKALAFWFVCHYVFNLQYCKQAKEVAMFFQEYVFGLTEISKNKGATYLSVCRDICKYVVEDMWTIDSLTLNMNNIELQMYLFELYLLLLNMYFTDFLL